MKRIVSILVCWLSFSAFAGDVTAEWEKMTTFFTEKSFDIKKFDAALEKTRFLQRDIDHKPKMGSYTLLHIAVNQDNVPVLKLLIEKYHSNFRQHARGPSSNLITSHCLYMSAWDSYKYLRSLQTEEENDERRDADQEEYIEGIKDDAAHEERMRHLRFLTKDHDKIMKDLKSFKFKDLMRLLFPVSGTIAGSW